MVDFPVINSSQPAAGASPAAPAQGKKEKGKGKKSGAYAPLLTPSSPVYQSCLVPQLSPEDYHFCILRANWYTREQNRRNTFKKTTAILDQSLGMVDNKPRGIIARLKAALFSASRRANLQADNWLLLEAAKKCIEMYFYSRGEQKYLDDAKRYIEIALKNRDTKIPADTYTFSFKELFSPPIYPVEGYFELKLTLFHLLNLSNNYKSSIALGKQIEAELGSLRVVRAQRSNPVSARGFLNRLYVLYGFAGLYNPAMDSKTAFESLNRARDWAAQEHAKSATRLKVWEMNKKDLRYDTLLSKVLEGRLLVKTGSYAKAAAVFKEVFNEPDAFKKYGGFLDIGLAAFFGLMHIALITSKTREEAAQKFDRAIPWDRIAKPEFEDLREALGLIIRQQKLHEKVSSLLDARMPDLYQTGGDLSLYLGSPSLAPKDTTALISEIKLDNHKTPRQKMELFIELIKYAQLTYDQKRDVISSYDRKGPWRQ